VNMFNNLPGPSSIVETVVSGTKALTEKYEARYPAVFPAYHTLKKCYEKLQEIRALLDGLSEARRRKIQIASKRGACLSLEDHEGEWTRLMMDYNSLCRLYDQSSSFQRYFPGNHLRIDISTFEIKVKAFYSDVWKTTSPGERSIHWRSLQTNMA